MKKLCLAKKLPYVHSNTSFSSKMFQSCITTHVYVWVESLEISAHTRHDTSLRIASSKEVAASGQRSSQKAMRPLEGPSVASRKRKPRKGKFLAPWVGVVPPEWDSQPRDQKYSLRRWDMKRAWSHRVPGVFFSLITHRWVTVALGIRLQTDKSWLGRPRGLQPADEAEIIERSPCHLAFYTSKAEWPAPLIQAK